MIAASNGMTPHPTLSEDDPIPISLVVHQAFCPRRAWLEVMGEHTDTGQVATGIAEHGGTDDATGHAIAAFASAALHRGKATPVRRKAQVTPPMRAQLARSCPRIRRGQDRESSDIAARCLGVWPGPAWRIPA